MACDKKLTHKDACALINFMPDPYLVSTQDLQMYTSVLKLDMDQDRIIK